MSGAGTHHGRQQELAQLREQEQTRAGASGWNFTAAPGSGANTSLDAAFRQFCAPVQVVETNKPINKKANRQRVKQTSKQVCKTSMRTTSA